MGGNSSIFRRHGYRARPLALEDVVEPPHEQERKDRRAHRHEHGSLVKYLFPCHYIPLTPMPSAGITSLVKVQTIPGTGTGDVGQYSKIDTPYNMRF